jgi:predicted TIM-barrel fold metal-dependent hydrolase
MKQIIDSHAHVDEVEAWGWMDPPEVLIELLDEAGIDQAVVMTYRDATGMDDPATLYTVEAVNRYPDRLIGYLRLNPQVPGALDVLDQAFQHYRLKGLKLHPVSYVGFPYGEATVRAMKRAAAYHAPVLFHSGDEALALPEEVIEAARLCPEATVILGHMGGYFHVEAAIDLAASLPNVLLDTSAMPYPAMIRRAIDAVGTDRVLFASDGPGCLPALEIEKVRLAGLTEAELGLVLGGNIRRVLDKVRHDL